MSKSEPKSRKDMSASKKWLGYKVFLMALGFSYGFAGNPCDTAVLLSAAVGLVLCVFPV